MTSSPPAPLPAHLSVTVLKRGGWGKADILRLRHARGEAILKDYSAKSGPVRLFGRRQLRREMRALARLRGLGGVPEMLAPLPPCGMLLEPLEGEPITRWRRRDPGEVAALIARLEEMIERLHERGVAHLDLRKRDNILVDAAGRPGIIDFNASVCCEPGGLAARLLFPLLRRVDRSALLKWKSLLAPDRMTPAERRRHRRMSLLRRLWIFN